MSDQDNAAGFRFPSSSITGPLGGDVDEQLSRALERLRFYESFDRLIQDNIARSGDLLREAADLRERAQREIARAQADLDRTVTAREERHRLLLAILLDELAQMRRQNDRLYERIAEALADSEARRPPNAAPGDLGGSLDATRADRPPLLGTGVLVPGSSPSPTPVTEPAPDVTPSAPDVTPSALDASAVDDRLAQVVAFEAAAGTPTGGAGEEPSQTEDRAPAWRSLDVDDTETAARPAALDGPAELGTGAQEAPEVPQSGPRPVMVLVHGVPRAAAALSLQRHLAGLEHVETVEAREYAEGVLRLQVMASRPLVLDDLRSWNGGTDLQSVHVQPDVVEVKLPGAETL